MLAAAEEARLHELESGPPLAEPQMVLLPQHILGQAQSQPQALAVTCGSNRRSYGELERAARALASQISQGAAQIAAAGLAPVSRRVRSNVTRLGPKRKR